jgi:hypothetical protein
LAAIEGLGKGSGCNTARLALKFVTSRRASDFLG